MADNYREGDVPLGGQEQQSVSEAAREQFQEQLRSAQAAVKQIKKDEGAAKAFDNTLAHIISSILQQGGYDHIIVLISDLIESNVPSDFLLALLSLIFEEAYQKAQQKLLAEGTQQVALLGQNNFSGNTFSSFPHEKQIQLRDWGDLIVQISFKDAEKVLETVIKIETWDIHPSLLALVSHLIIEFAKESHITMQLPETREFSRSFIQKLIDSLQDYINRKH